MYFVCTVQVLTPAKGRRLAVSIAVIGSRSYASISTGRDAGHRRRTCSSTQPATVSACSAGMRASSYPCAVARLLQGTFVVCENDAAGVTRDPVPVRTKATLLKKSVVFPEAVTAQGPQ